MAAVVACIADSTARMGSVTIKRASGTKQATPPAAPPRRWTSQDESPGEEVVHRRSSQRLPGTAEQRRGQRAHRTRDRNVVQQCQRPRRSGQRHTEMESRWHAIVGTLALQSRCAFAQHRTDRARLPLSGALVRPTLAHCHSERRARAPRGPSARAHHVMARGKSHNRDGDEPKRGLHVREGMATIPRHPATTSGDGRPE